MKEGESARETFARRRLLIARLPADSDKVWTWPSETDIYVPQFFALDLAHI